MSVFHKLNWMMEKETKPLNKRKRRKEGEYYVEKYKVTPFLPNFIYINNEFIKIQDTKRPDCKTIPKQLVIELLEDGILKHVFKAEFRRTYLKQRRNMDRSSLVIFTNRLIAGDWMNPEDTVKYILLLASE